MQNNNGAKVKTYLRNGKIVIPKNFFNGLEDGEHVVEIEDVELIEFKEGALGVKLTCKNSQSDVGIYSIYMDDNPYSMFGQLIKACCEEPVDEIDQEALVGYIIEIQVRTRGNYQNLVGITTVSEEEFDLFLNEREKADVKPAKKKKKKDNKMDEDKEEDEDQGIRKRGGRSRSIAERSSNRSSTRRGTSSNEESTEELAYDMNRYDCDDDEY